MQVEADRSLPASGQMPVPVMLPTQVDSLAQVACLQSPLQHTLSQSFTCAGVGLHSGQYVQVHVHPAAPDQGRYFVRTDLADAPEIPAHVDAVKETLLSTMLAHGSATVRTVEHLLAALAGVGVDNARIEIDGPEVPLLDGSALDWVGAIATAGLTPQASPRRPYTIARPAIVEDGDAFAIALPAAATHLSYGIEFAPAAIGRQWFSLPLAEVLTEVAPARTFGLATQVETLRARGLIKGGSLENALVCGLDGWLNPPLRYTNEPVRHKLLDLIGDLSLLGLLPRAHILAYKASHALHVQLAQRLVPLGLDH